MAANLSEQRRASKRSSNAYGPLPMDVQPLIKEDARGVDDRRLSVRGCSLARIARRGA
jgi:hypothetical protein